MESLALNTEIPLYLMKDGTRTVRCTVLAYLQPRITRNIMDVGEMEHRLSFMIRVKLSKSKTTQIKVHLKLQKILNKNLARSCKE